MLVTSWILFVMFSLIALLLTRKFLFTSVKGYAEIFVWIFSIIISAVSAGVIWGGLFKDFIR